MKNFEYAAARTEQEALELLSSASGTTVLLAGGTDLVGLMKSMIVQPDRVVDVGQVATMGAMNVDDDGRLWVGACVKLQEFLRSGDADVYPAVKQVIQGISSPQLQAQGSVVGELLRRPCCWYFRNGHGLLADSGRCVAEGDNRYHAIFGNRGAAKFVNASRLAPALISLRAQVRIVGPAADDEQFLPLEMVYQIPRREGERENGLGPRQLVTHLILAADDGSLSASYEVRQGEGPDAPLTAAAATLRVLSGRVQRAQIVLGQVAPIPWISAAAASALVGRPLNERTASDAAQAAVADATPLSGNGYKVQLAAVAVKRAILRAGGLDWGGF